jgi:hypothetical protein
MARRPDGIGTFVPVTANLAEQHQLNTTLIML